MLQFEKPPLGYFDPLTITYGTGETDWSRKIVPALKSSNVVGNRGDTFEVQ